MNKPPAFQFYADDFLAGTFDLDLAEVGAYIRLLCHQWNRGSIPVQKDKLSKLAGGVVSDEVIAKFKRGPEGQMKNLRLEMERKKQDDYRRKQSEKGRKSGESRRRNGHEPRLNNGSTSVEPSVVEPDTNSPSPLPSPSPSNKAKPTKLHGKPFGQVQVDLTKRYDTALGERWENDRRKWMGRIKENPLKCDRVISEVENASREGRVKTTTAQYAEQIWKEFA